MKNNVQVFTVTTVTVSESDYEIYTLKQRLDPLMFGCPASIKADLRAVCHLDYSKKKNGGPCWSE